jgi:hypothetical protein
MNQRRAQGSPGCTTSLSKTVSATLDRADSFFTARRYIPSFEKMMVVSPGSTSVARLLN